MADDLVRYSPGDGLLIRRPGWLAFLSDHDQELIELLRSVAPETLFRSLARFIVGRDFEVCSLIAITDSPRRIMVLGDLDISTTTGDPLPVRSAMTWSELQLPDRAGLSFQSDAAATTFELNDGIVPAGSFSLNPLDRSHRRDADARDDDRHVVATATAASDDSPPSTWDPLADPDGLDLERLGDTLPPDDTITTIALASSPAAIEQASHETASAAAPLAAVVARPEPAASSPSPKAKLDAPPRKLVGELGEDEILSLPGGLGAEVSLHSDPTLPQPTISPGPPLADGATVMAVPCAAGHANPPGSTRCRHCDGSIEFGARPEQMPRDSLGWLVFDDGQRFELVANAIVGRNPAKGGMPDGVEGVVIRGDQVSRRHFTVDLVGWSVRITDCGSRNGTETRRSGDGGRTRIPEGGSVEIEPGCVVHFGDRFATYEAG
jgi:hypothetical protein